MNKILTEDLWDMKACLNWIKDEWKYIDIQDVIESEIGNIQYYLFRLHYQHKY